MNKQLWLLSWCLAALLGGTTHALANTPWQWLDESGRKVYSDLPPPANVPSKNILKQPGNARTYVPPAVPAPAEETKQAGTPAKTKPVDAAEDKKKREADKAEEAKRKAQEEKVAATMADNCQRARTSLATLQSGVRLMTSNASGEQMVMDDTQREQESQRLRQIMAENCR